MNAFIKTTLISLTLLCSSIACASKFNVTFEDLTKKLGSLSDAKLCFGIFPPNSTIAPNDTAHGSIALFYEPCFSSNPEKCRGTSYKGSVFADFWVNSQARVAIYPASKDVHGMSCNVVPGNSKRIVSHFIDVPDVRQSYNISCTYDSQSDWKNHNDGNLTCKLGSGK